MSTKDDPRLGVALSGGGHRASLFALGALLYLVHAKRDDGSSVASKVSCITSVSGGSITNGYIGQMIDFPTATLPEFESVATQLASHIANRGTLFATWHAKVLLLAIGLSLLLVVLSVCEAIASEHRLLYGILAFGATIAAMGLLQLRGHAFSWALAKTLFCDSLGRATTLSNLDQRKAAPVPTENKEWAKLLPDSSFRAVLCGTEVQTGLPVYFSRSGIDCVAFDLANEPEFVQLAVAVQSSAALPGAFPPRQFKAQQQSLAWEGPPPKALVVADGGVRDNLGVELFVQQHDLKPPGWFFPVSRVLVIGGAANKLKRRRLSRVLPWLGELPALWRAINFPYDTRERLQRRVLEQQFNRESTATGAVVHIEESPYDVAGEILENVEHWRWEGTPPSERSHSAPRISSELHARYYGTERALSHISGMANWWNGLDRAEAVLANLAKAEGISLNLRNEDERDKQLSTLKRIWATQTTHNASVATTLSAVGVPVAARLMRHAFALTMSRMHIVWGYPIVELPPESYFASLASLSDSCGHSATS